MEADAHRLVTFGAEVLAIPCNTAHYFYDKLEQTAGVPILNMVEQTVLHVKQRGVKSPPCWPPPAPWRPKPTSACLKSTAWRLPCRTKSTKIW